jgi:gluconolactonase
VAGGFRQTDGPVWRPEGCLLFCDIADNTIYKLTPNGRGMLPPSRFTSGNLMGCGGMTLDRKGRLIVCERGSARVSRVAEDGSITALADYFEGRRLNGPRDVVCRADGSLYFTDSRNPVSGDGQDDADELPFNGVFRIVEGRRLQLLVADLSQPGGLAFSPDQKFLYIANSDPNRMLWMRYKVESDGVLSNGRVFYDASHERECGLPEGLKVDRAGNVIATGPGGIWIFSPAGDGLGRIRVPEPPSNLHWAGDGTELYITARTSIYRMRWAIGGTIL